MVFYVGKYTIPMDGKGNILKIKCILWIMNRIYMSCIYILDDSSIDSSFIRWYFSSAPYWADSSTKASLCLIVINEIPTLSTEQRKTCGRISVRSPRRQGESRFTIKGCRWYAVYISHSTLILLDLTSLSPPVGDKIIYNNIINTIKTKLCSNSAYGKRCLGCFFVSPEACSVNTGWDLTAKPWANTQLNHAFFECCAMFPNMDSLHGC